MMQLTVGDKAPDFLLKDDSGQEKRLADFLDGVLVLYFYPRDNTPGCTLEAQDFRDLAREFADTGAKIVGVSKDSVSSHQTFKEKHGLPFTLLSDPTGEMVEAYGVWREKVMYGKKRMGLVRTTMVIGSDGVIRKIFDKVRVKGHARAVLEDLS